MRRLLIILYILVTFEVGVFLFVLPWVSMWSQNFFAARSSLVAEITRNYFVRGAVSGLGMVDVFLALFELWRFRHLLGLVRSAPNGSSLGNS
jgi:hypothetical protein